MLTGWRLRADGVRPATLISIELDKQRVEAREVEDDRHEDRYTVIRSRMHCENHKNIVAPQVSAKPSDDPGPSIAPVTRDALGVIPKDRPSLRRSKAMNMSRTWRIPLAVVSAVAIAASVAAAAEPHSVIPHPARIIRSTVQSAGDLPAVGSRWLITRQGAPDQTIQVDTAAGDQFTAHYISVVNPSIFTGTLYHRQKSLMVLIQHSGGDGFGGYTASQVGIKDLDSSAGWTGQWFDVSGSVGTFTLRPAG